MCVRVRVGVGMWVCVCVLCVRARVCVCGFAGVGVVGVGSVYNAALHEQMKYHQVFCIYQYLIDHQCPHQYPNMSEATIPIHYCRRCVPLCVQNILCPMFSGSSFIAHHCKQY
jgi:hypothetical protein